MQIIKDDNNRLLNMDEAAKLLGIKKSTLYQMVMRRKMAVVKISKLNRFRPEDLQAFINENLTERI